MYCVKCGVELGNSETSCPVCNTPVYHKELIDFTERPYPARPKRREVSRSRGFNYLVIVAFFMAMVISVICDLQVEAGLAWADYVIGALLLIYLIFALPTWFNAPSPAIFIPCDFLGIALFLAYISYRTGGGWFIGFAMPTVAFVGLIVCTVAILTRYIGRGYFYVYGGAFIALSAFSVVLEVLMNMTFELRDRLVWSIYPAVACFIIGVALFLIALIKPLRESFCKIFSI